MLAKYKCHKTVHAGRIVSIGPVDDARETYRLSVHTDDGSGFEPVTVSAAWMVKHQPKEGGYYISYQDGYESYSPAAPFLDGYARVDGSRIDFGEALRALKQGAKVAREGWNGKGMWLAYMPGFTIPAGMVNERTRKFVPEGQDIPCGGYIVMWTAQGTWQPGWLASQADMLAEDWVILD